MSGRRAKADRQRRGRRRGAGPASGALTEAAGRVLAVDLAPVPVTRTSQITVGWLRNALEQGTALAALDVAGLSHAGAPNRRLFFETVLRLVWLHSLPQTEREEALRARIAFEVGEEQKTAKHVQDLNDLSRIGTFELDEAGLASLAQEFPTVHGQTGEQARVLLAAVKATFGLGTGLYVAWREETHHAHASALLAAAYAPAADGKMGVGRPPVADPDFELHWGVMFLAVFLAVFLAAGLLLDEGAPAETTQALPIAFFGN